MAQSLITLLFFLTCYFIVISTLPTVEVQEVTWTFISGSHDISTDGVYGEKGNASIANAPGERYSAVGWYDSYNKEFWLFGGFGRAVNLNGSCMLTTSTNITTKNSHNRSPK